MVKEDDCIEKVRAFKERLSRSIPVEKMILFGSCARGQRGKYSDVDLMIVSRAFANKKREERAYVMYKHWEHLDPVDFICFTPEEFAKQKRHAMIVAEAVREGVVV